MRHIKLFEEFISITEGAIPVYPAGNPWKAEGSIQWGGVPAHMGSWLKTGTAISIVAEFDFDKYAADPAFRSVPNGNWKDKTKPKFSDKNPGYDEGEFDVLGIEDNPDKPEKTTTTVNKIKVEHSKEPWIRIADKKGHEFLIPAFRILDIQKGSSVRDGIASGHAYLIDDQRGTIKDYVNGEVIVQLQNKQVKHIPVADWKAKRYTELD
jgi:hypothetical protein